ncbi:hypothetical protein [Macrococcoides caseolyticum]|uniref:hypothetical protein n=1 Tax=Macrococcoides caseolyticum TaxID=69966 RepID=UPI001E6298CA|nr:hypothetical protein [Macrococcus caseolyticus]
MKKVTIILIIITLLTINNISNAEELNIKENHVSIEQYQKNISGIKELHAKRLVSLLKSNKKYYLYIGFQECPYCRDFSKTLSDFSSNANLPIYYFNLNSGNSKLNESDKKLIEKVLNEIERKCKFKRNSYIFKD